MSTVLIISPEPWDGHFVSKHHYAMELVRQGLDVLFFGPPDDKATDIAVERVERNGAALRLVRSNRVARGLGRMPSLLRNRLERLWLDQLELVAGKRIDVVWLFENSRFFDMRFAGDRLKIYHQVDLNQDFHPAKAASTADLAIAVSGPIERRIKPAARRFLRLGHGVATAPESPIPEALLDQRFAGPARHVVLTGNLDMIYLDVDLLSTLVHDNPTIRLHFVGSYSDDGKLFQATKTASNVIWWGRQRAEALPSILRRADLLLVAYLADIYRDQLANPHKVMEYLASGTPILATHTEEYADRPDLVVMAADADDFRKRFKTMLNDPIVLADPEARQHRQRFAAERSYAHQFACIADALEQSAPNRNPLKQFAS